MVMMLCCELCVLLRQLVGAFKCTQVINVFCCQEVLVL